MRSHLLLPCMLLIAALVAGCGSGSNNGEPTDPTNAVYTTKESAAAHLTTMQRWAGSDLTTARHKDAKCHADDYYSKVASSGETIYRDIYCDFSVTLADGSVHVYHLKVSLRVGGWDIVPNEDGW